MSPTNRLSPSPSSTKETEELLVVIQTQTVEADKVKAVVQASSNV